MCVRELEKLGVDLRHHNAPLYSGGVVGELRTSGCFLRESAKHRKFKLVCGARTCVRASAWECSSDGKPRSFIAVLS